MKVRELQGVEIALLLMRTGQGGEDDWAVLKGSGIVMDDALYIDRGPDHPLFPVPSDAIPRLREVTEDISEILFGAQWCIPLTVGRVDEDVDPRTLADAGFRWPE